MKFSKANIESLKETITSEVYLWDKDLPGFGVRFYPSGKVTYIIRYRTKTYQSRKLTIARFEEMSIDKARGIARDMFYAIRLGKDPSTHGKGISFSQFVERYRSEYLIHRKPRTIKTYNELLDSYILPHLGKFAMEDIKKPDVISMHLKVSASGPKVRANRSVNLISSLFNLAKDWGVLPEDYPNPAARVKKHKEQARKRSLQKIELPKFWKAVQESEHWQIQALALLLLFTGARRGEILNSRKEWIDWDNRILKLPDSKTGQKEIMLSRPALEILSRISKPGETGFILPSPVKKDAAFSGVYKPWKKILEAAGISDFTFHDIRHTVGTFANSAGIPLPGIAKILTHRTLKMTERYVETFSEQDEENFEKTIALIESSAKEI
jgi:integrase